MIQTNRGELNRTNYSFLYESVLIINIAFSIVSAVTGGVKN